MNAKTYWYAKWRAFRAGYSAIPIITYTSGGKVRHAFLPRPHAWG